jgi:hypothetical protein
VIIFIAAPEIIRRQKHKQEPVKEQMVFTRGWGN